MTDQEAKEILSVYRPGTADDREPEFVEALACARQNPELRDWFAKHSAVQRALRARFRQIAAPEGLKEQIISEHKTLTVRQRWRRPVALVAIAATIALLITVALSWIQSNTKPEDKVDLATFRNRMVGAVSRRYTMTLETNDLNQIRAHLAQSQAPANYVLPKGLDKTASTGCGVLSWQDKRVSMVCFHTGKPLPPGEKTDIFLFVVGRGALPGAPAGGKPLIAKVKNLMTASWTLGQNVYVLATEGDETSIRQYMN